mmetsp:Transcript_1901/g.2101  ORF Transcript_1901/g.2101 Transcript_1901/m.2101 type:complete len:305 (-) Transcript_1901:46-960(-)|eukprot:CAMPEP_0197860772 /NCGR_PEP_ID=MMETSP1438-20131217/36385_1 /TAXON_ID=1461541 /ORGANISM="Pterosperma sp., Strain CCMP1384" /LENGTH=304 /DNA_ID=CAMNT_0043477753 /DNA_START=153 /DNA_END=1067 /DNA_ORIENTATION=+
MTVSPPRVSAAAAVDEQMAPDDLAISVNSLQFAFPGNTPFINDFTLKLPPGSRCLLCGANGAGKSTLLQVLAGKFMVSKDMISVYGQPPFHTTSLTCSGDLTYLGGSWKRDVAFVGGDVPLQGDMSAEQMIFGVKGVDPERRDRLIKLLDVDLSWNLIRTSDGQRRRVQICMGLLHPYQVLLMDEITVDLDVVSRLDLLQFFKEECEERGATIMYATHIFDGMEQWATHMAYVTDGVLKTGGRVETVKELVEGKRLLDVMEAWLRIEHKERKEKAKLEPSMGGNKPKGNLGNPFMPSKHMAFYR